MANLIMNPSKTLLKKIQGTAALPITGAIRVISREGIFDELRLEYLADRRWHRRMTFFYKIVKNIAPEYLQSYLFPTR